MSSGGAEMDARDASSGKAQVAEDEPDMCHQSPSSFAPDWDPDDEPYELFVDLKRKEKEVLDDPVLLAELSRLVFMRRTYVDSEKVRHHYVASSADTLEAITQLLARRNAFLTANDLPKPLVLIDPERKKIMGQ